jgi:oligopeptide transport system substrate-binding protein
VKFQDGRQLTAGDFKYSWERACSPQTGSQTALTYLGDIAGVAEMLAGKAQSLSGVKVINDFTLEVTITASHPYFLYKLGYSTAFVVDKNNVAQGTNWWQTPNGTGPFKLKTWTTKQQLVLERNDNYYGEKAKMATVTYKLWSGVPQRLYETGDIDATEVGSDYIDMVTDPEGQYLSQLNIYPELSFSYIGFNCAKPPFDDPNIRKAFALAVDKTKLASLLFKDMVTPAGGILPSGMPGYNDQLHGLDYDIALAKELIEQSQYGDVSNLPAITITTSGYGAVASSTLTAIIYDWKQNLGVDVKVRVLEPQMFFYSLKTEKDELFDIGWIADYPHPQDFLEVLFRSGADNNWGEYSNTDVDALLTQAGVEPDNAKALVLYQQAEQKLVDDAACIPLWFGKNYFLTKPYVSGYAPNAMGIVKLSKVSVSK